MTVTAEYELVTTVDGVRDVVDMATNALRIGLSAEMNAMHAYNVRVCLIALSIDDRLALLDVSALRLRPMALRPLEALIEGGTGPRLIVHGGEQLVAAFKRDLRFAPNRLFDIQQAASLIGWPRTGLRALIERVTGQVVAPRVAVDWGTRPLPPGAAEAALEHVRWLPRLAAALEAAVTAADLEEEVEIASAEVAWTPAGHGRPESDGFMELPGARRLPEPAMRVLRAAFLWRDAKARELDVPPDRLIKNAVLVELAVRPPGRGDDIARTPFHSRLLYGDRQELEEVIERASVGGSPVPPKRERPPPSPARRERTRRLKAWREEEARARDVGLQAILPKKSLDYLAIHGGDDLAAVPMLGTRRATRYAEVLRALCAVED
ncbi:MAG: HRDC domain-containing protein [Deltaproteobacteria bacterium]|nr:HRDC domain-containing protein [Deltaproteobacteria bacterium]